MQSGVDGGGVGRSTTGLETTRRSTVMAGDRGKDEQIKKSLEFGGKRLAGLRGVGDGMWWPLEARRAASEWIWPCMGENRGNFFIMHGLTDEYI